MPGASAGARGKLVPNLLDNSLQLPRMWRKLQLGPVASSSPACRHNLWHKAPKLPNLWHKLLAALPHGPWNRVAIRYGDMCSRQCSHVLCLYQLPLSPFAMTQLHPLRADGEQPKTAVHIDSACQWQVMQHVLHVIALRGVALHLRGCLQGSLAIPAPGPPRAVGRAAPTLTWAASRRSMAPNWWAYACVRPARVRLRTCARGWSCEHTCVPCARPLCQTLGNCSCVR